MEYSQDEFFEISAVAKLTGVSPHLLRMWERRYGVVEPDRSDSRRRRYTRGDIRKLTLLKELVDSGHAIGSIASLSLEQLEDRRSEVIGKEDVKGGINMDSLSCRIAAVGQNVVHLINELSSDHPGLRLIGQFRSARELGEALKAGVADILVIESETLFRDDVAEWSELAGALEIRHIVAICDFSQREAIEDIDPLRFSHLKAPVGASELLHACAEAVAGNSGDRGEEAREAGGEAESAAPPVSRPETGEIPPRRYSHSDLLKIGKISSVVQCECPQHLARLISSLSAFESYSRQCEDRNEDDAKLHAYLHQATAQCRGSMEDALAEVLRQEEIDW